MTPEEEGRLLVLAGAQRVTIPRLLVESALASDSGETSAERRSAMAELFAIHRFVGAMSRNVNQLAKIANATGTLESETRATLARLRDTADRIDAAIVELSGR